MGAQAADREHVDDALRRAHRAATNYKIRSYEPRRRYAPSWRGQAAKLLDWLLGGAR